MRQKRGIGGKSIFVSGVTHDQRRSNESGDPSEDPAEAHLSRSFQEEVDFQLNKFHLKFDM
jgi:hypothetical protein